MKKTEVIHPAMLMSFDVLVAGLNKEVELGNVYRRESGDGLSQYTYSKDCVYANAWNEFSMLARGLILDIENKQVIALCFPKFFNVSEGKSTLPDLPFETFEKVDGSLIIIFHYNGKWRTATKGSFDSDQAKWAAKQLEKSDTKLGLIPGFTYLAEAIYPENKIVIEYEKSELVLLGGYTARGHELNYNQLKFIANFMNWGIAPRYSYDSIGDLIANAKHLPGNREGFVIRFKNGLRVKIKGDEYCRIHSLVSRLSPLTVWEAFVNGRQSVEEMRKELPEEFWPDFDSMYKIFEDKWLKIVSNYHRQVNSYKNFTNKEIGLSNIDRDVKSFIFSCRKDTQYPASTACKLWIGKTFRPTDNVLEGYTPSYGIKMVQEDL